MPIKVLASACYYFFSFLDFSGFDFIAHCPPAFHSLAQAKYDFCLFFRWAKLRAAMVPLTILLEPLSECILLGLLAAWSVFYLFRWDPLSFFLLHILIWFLMDWVLIHVVQNGSLPFNKFEFLVCDFYVLISTGYR